MLASIFDCLLQKCLIFILQILIYNLAVRMESKEKNKKQLCKFINKCNKFKQNTCPYLHDQCKNGSSCAFALKCKFYHPELEGERNSNPSLKKTIAKINAPCKFHPNCTKIGCPFLHDTQETPSLLCKYGLTCKKNAIGQCKLQHVKKQIDFNRQCRDGLNCKRYAQGTCKFRHQGGPNNSNPKQEDTMNYNPIPVKKNEIVTQEGGQKKFRESLVSNVDYSQEYKTFERNKLCYQFACGNCQNYNCERDHQFTIDNSIKRMFYRVMSSQETKGNKPCPLSQMFQINGKVLFAICNENKLGFYQVDGENQVLKPVQSKQLRLNEKITGLFISKQKQIVLLITTQLKGTVYIYKPLLGVIQEIKIQPHAQISSITTFLEDSIVLVGSTNQSLIIRCSDKKREGQILKKIEGTKLGERASKIVKKFTILDENFLITTSQYGNINFINKNFEVKTIDFPDLAPYEVVSLHACAIKERPLLFVAIQQLREKKHYILQVNLLNLNKQIAMNCQNLAISQISSASDKFFLSIHNIGTLVYNLPDLKRLKGRIPFNQKHLCLDADDQGNLFIITEGFNPPTGSCQTISIYKIRK